MSVYVDSVSFHYGCMRMCHMWADTKEELFKMARKIGLNTKHFQCPPKASWEHFDVCRAYRDKAIALGAILTDKYGAVAHVAYLRGDTRKMEQVYNARKRLIAPSQSVPLSS